ncbi:zinc ribbon domain-containing protein [Marinospirillum sp.]
MWIAYTATGICQACGTRLDRDVNAARNILALGHERPAEGILAL